MAAQLISTSKKARRLSVSEKILEPLLDTVFKQAWDKIDNDEERTTLQNDEALANLNPLVREKLSTSTQKLNKSLVDKREEHSKKAAEKRMTVDASYKGPRITDDKKIDLAFVNELINSFKDNGFLHYRYTQRILTEALELLKKDNALQTLSIPQNGNFVVVGDLHGQLPDLLTVIRLGGFPSTTNSYLFNGDLVDRGPHGIEVLLIVYALKIALPNNVFINRGNHELRRMNEKYDLHDQVFDKYDQDMFELVSETFLYIPFCAVLENKVFVVHGGTFQYEDVTLKELKELDNERGKDLPRHKGIERRGQLLIENMMWSDPDKSVRKWKESVRGAGIIFGAECVKVFLKNNQLDVVIRSHQMIDPGYEKLFDDTLITVFSASCYAMHNDNQGAILIYNHGATDWKNPKVLQYYADVLVQGLDERKENREADTLHKLYDRIFEYRHRLKIAFESKQTAEYPGCVTEEAWVDVLKSVLQLDINWQTLRPYLAKREDDTHVINYSKFLERFQITIDKNFLKEWQRDVVSHVCGKFIKYHQDLLQAFNEIDTDKNGHLSYTEFATALSRYDLGLTETQTYEFISSVDADKNGLVDYLEFKNRFGHEFGKAEHSTWIKNTVNDLAKKIVSSHKTVKQSFLTFDSDGDHRISYQEFSTILKRDLGGESFTREQRRELFDYIDENKSGAISYKEFKAAFSLGDTMDKTWENQIIQTVCDAIRRTVFREMDKDRSGKVDPQEFKAGLEGMNILLENPMTEAQIGKLHKAMDKDNDGAIDYEEFLKCFDVKLIL